MRTLSDVLFGLLCGILAALVATAVMQGCEARGRQAREQEWRSWR